MADEKKSNKLVLILALVLLLVMFGSGFFIFQLVMAKSAEAAPPEEEVIGPRFEIAETTVNFNGRTNQYLLVKLAFEAADEEVALELEEKKDILMHVVNLVLMEQTQEVLNPEGKLKLIKVLIKNVNDFLTKGEIKNVYIQKFLIT